MGTPIRLNWRAAPWSALLVSLLAGLLGCSAEGDHSPHQAASLSVQNYPGSVLWYNPGNDDQRVSGRSVSIGREAFSLPEYQVAFNLAQSYLAAAPVGRGHCLNGDLPLALVPRDSAELPPDESLSRLSVVFWAKWHDGNQPLLTLGSGAEPSLQLRARDNRVELEQHGLDGRSSRITSHQLEPGQWHHLAITLNRIGPPEAERGLVLHVNAERQGDGLALPFFLEHLHLRFQQPSGPANPTCFSDIVVLLDPIASSTVADLYELSGRQAGALTFPNNTDLPNGEPGSQLMRHQH